MTHPHHRRHGLRSRARLSGPRLVATWTIVAAVWATGACWLILHYFFRVQGQFGPTPNPMEKWAIAAHGATAFATLWLGGLLWIVHLRPAWRNGSRSPSGLSVATVLALLTATGYLLYYAGGDVLRARVALIHWTAGLATLPAFIVHVALRRKRAG